MEGSPQLPPEPQREVRLALVMNGGVSLAVWIGGVTREIDCARRASASLYGGEPLDEPGTASCYASLLRVLAEKVTVDVIAGASAGGINGALLAAATFARSPLPDLRETWLEIGDFTELLRSPSEPEPPSVLRGDDVVLATLRRILRELLATASPARRPLHPLYLYVTGTDLRGARRAYYDTAGREFWERDHRRTFQFRFVPSALPETSSVAPETYDRTVMPRVVELDTADAAELLARAARATSSFPVAFEPHELLYDDGAETTRRWLIDGGVLDNQPFTPVLDRIDLIPAGIPVRRVVGFVIPYVNDPDQRESADDDDAPPTAMDTYGASGALPRTLPKLDSLDRVRRQQRSALDADDARRRLYERPDEALAAAAESLLPSYRQARRRATARALDAWAAPGFVPGGDVEAQDEAIDSRYANARFRDLGAVDDDESRPWIPTELAWRGNLPTWDWGLAAAERVAVHALACLRDRLRQQEWTGRAQQAVLVEAREEASSTIWWVRARKEAFCRAFLEQPPSLAEERGAAAYEALGLPAEIQRRMRNLDTAILSVNRSLEGADRVPTVQKLLHGEVVANALTIADSAYAAPFEFLYMSAGVRNSLGHSAATPAEKLAGMKLGHFSGFLKRSWRANDWLWGRLDGVEHLLRCLVDRDYVRTARERGGDEVIHELAALAFPDEEAAELLDAWRRTKTVLEQALAPELPTYDPGGPRLELAGLLVEAVTTEDGRRGRALIDACRSALAAPIQLEILRGELTEVARAAQLDADLGSNRAAGGLAWAERIAAEGDAQGESETHRLRRRFLDLDVGRERAEDELATRRGIGLLSQALGVASNAFAGKRGGLPGVARGALASVHGTVTVATGIGRAFAFAPLIGFTAVLVAVGLLVWAIEAPGVLLGALVPALGTLALAGLGFAAALFTSPLEGRLKGLRWAGLTVLLLLALGGAVALAVLADDLDVHITSAAAFVAAGLLAVAALAAVWRFVVELWRRSSPPWSLRARLYSLRLYRVALVLAAGAIAGGFLARQIDDEESLVGAWATVADDWKGALVVAVLLAVAVATPILSTAWARRRR